MSLDKNARSFILENFYFSNPDLLPPIPKEKNPSQLKLWVLDEFNGLEQELKLKFELDLKIYRGSIRQTWLAASNKEKVSLKKENDKLKNIFYHIKSTESKVENLGGIIKLYADIVNIKNDSDRVRVLDLFLKKLINH